MSQNRHKALNHIFKFMLVNSNMSPEHERFGFLHSERLQHRCLHLSLLETDVWGLLLSPLVKQRPKAGGFKKPFSVFTQVTWVLYSANIYMLCPHVKMCCSLQLLLPPPPPLFLSASSSICLCLLSRTSILLALVRSRSWALSSATSSMKLCLRGHQNGKLINDHPFILITAV